MRNPGSILSWEEDLTWEEDLIADSPPETFYELLHKIPGFERMPTGGGCEAWILVTPRRNQVWITDDSGVSVPDDHSVVVLLGFFDQDGDQYVPSVVDEYFREHDAADMSLNELLHVEDVYEIIKAYLQQN